MATEQALREQNQQLRKQLEDMKAQVQALIANATQFAQSPYTAPYRGNYQPQNRQPAYYSQLALTPQVLIHAPQQQQAQIQRRNNPPTLQYHPLPFPEADIYEQLVAEGLLSPVPTRPWVLPYPTWYNPNVKCAYHSSVTGHSTENCARMRQKIYELINTGSIKLDLVE